MAYITTPGFGLQLADPATVQQFETSVVNADFLALEDGILVERARINTANTNIANLQSGEQKTVANIAALTAIATAVVGERRVLLDPGTTGVTTFVVEMWAGSGAGSDWRPSETIIVDTKAHLDTFIAAWIADTDLTFKVGGMVIVTATNITYEFTTTAGGYAPISGRVKPTAISNTGGTATIGADGSIDIAGATVVTLTNAFLAYENFDTDAFEIVISGVMGSAGTVSMKLAAAGTVDAGINTYDTKGLTITQAGVSASASALATTQWFLSNNVGCVVFEATLELRHAAETKNTRGFLRAQVVVTAGTTENELVFGLGHRNANAFDGFQLTFSQAFTGVVLIKAKV